MRWLLYLLTGMLLAGAVAVAGIVYVLYEFGADLPEHQQLAGYEPPVVTRIHAGDGGLLAEFARQHRIFVPVNAIPRRVVGAFLAAEDKNFYSHPGVDIPSLAGAAIANLRRLGTDQRPRGASTITQQVAKNFLLTNEVSLRRKIKEAILAFRLERALTKDRILELYLNEIYLGYRSYGVAAAALNYFDKPLDELTIAEAAYLAALPKAPNNYHPIRRPAAAVGRRDWVIDQMRRNGIIADGDAAAATAEPLAVRAPTAPRFTRADYFVEEVRRDLLSRYGEEGLYGGGLSVRTTLDPRLQGIAQASLRQGLIAYDRRHGWRGPVARLPTGTGGKRWAGALAGLDRPSGAPDEWRMAVVLAAGHEAARIGFADGRTGMVPLELAQWARQWRRDQTRGPKVTEMRAVLAAGDVVLVSPAPEAEAGGADRKGRGEAGRPDRFALEQVPDVGGALVALDPHTGRVLAMVGGWDHASSQFNRAVQARRQMGSAFKPFVYLAALDSGFTPSTRILDAPFVIDQGPGLKKWKPANYTRKFYGPSPMRLGIEKSRNLMTVRLAQTIGMEQVARYARRFGVVDALPQHLSMALGAGETTLLRLTTAYAMLVNGGRRITPSLIDRIQNRNGATVYRHDDRPCAGCRQPGWDGQPVPALPDLRERVADSASAYQMVSMLEGVVRRGTGRRIRDVGKPLAGKTGTTNDYIDAWFIGFSPDLAVGVFVGFDRPRTLGDRESATRVAVPIFRQFMREALADAPAIPFRVPAGIRHVRINTETGGLARPGDRKVVVEAFRPGTEPGAESRIIDGRHARGNPGAWPSPAGGPVPAVVRNGSGLY